MAQRGAQIRIAGKAAEMEARVEVKIIRRPADVRRYITRPVDIVRDEMTAIRVAIPLPGGRRDSYLVLEVKGDALRQLMRSTGSERDLKSWIRENQRGMLEEYSKQKKSSFAFRLLPFRWEPSGIIPRKTELVPALPSTMRKEAELPKEITKGNGTSAFRYEVHLEKGERMTGVGGEVVPAPFVFEVADIKVYFTVYFTVHQLARGSKDDTLEKLRSVFRPAILCHAAKGGLSISPGSDVFMATRDAMSGLGRYYEGTMRSAVKAAAREGRDDIIRYLETH